MNLTGRGPGRDKGEVHSGRISQNFNRLFRSVKLAPEEGRKLSSLSTRLNSPNAESTWNLRRFIPTRFFVC